MALFGLIKKKIIAADLSWLHTDIHSHFIPGLDDGAKSMEDSLEMIMAMESLGYKKLITTPHVISDSYKNTPETILGGLSKLKEAVTKAGIGMELEAAAEYYLDYDLKNKIEQRNILTFGADKKYLLWEISFVNPPENLNDTIFSMQTHGYTPVLAHVERYNFWHRDYQKYEQLASRGVLLQMNINSLTGHYSGETKKAAQWLIDNNLISLLGSDCHHIGHIRLLKQALKEKYLGRLLASGKLLNQTL